MDINAEIGKATVGLLADFTKTLFSAGYEKSKDELQKISVAYGNAFKKYIERSSKKFQKIKTILDPSTPTSLIQIFEPPRFKIGDRNFNFDEYIEKIMKDKMAIVTGLGGSGKSVFLKYTFLHCAKMGWKKVPVYIELRDAKKDVSIEDLIIEQVNIKENITDIGFHHALSTGRFIFLLDAYDEVDEDNREDVGKQIKELAYKYDENVFLVSSRPSDEFKDWYEFYVSEIRPFSREQVLSLVSRLKYEQGAKERFSKAIENKLYRSHAAYLSNPLLCIIMLMTFDQGAGIPEKQHLFFDLAFDVLFYKHDATKGGHYRRLFLTQLPIDRFKAAFGSFSAFSYISKGSSFARSEAVEFAGHALAYDKIERDPEDLVSDMTKRMCLLLKEGNRYSYIHRTFQEYFTAYFLSQREFDGWEKVVHQIVLEKPNDNVVPMLKDMNPVRFEQYYIKPWLEAFLSVIAKVDKNENPGGFCKNLLLGFGLERKDPYPLEWWTVGSRKNEAPFYFLLNLLGREIFVEVARESWLPFMSLNPIPSTSEEDTDDEAMGFYFEELSAEQIHATPIYKFLVAFERQCRENLEQINRDLENKNRLVASSILSRLSGMQSGPFIE